MQPEGSAQTIRVLAEEPQVETGIGLITFASEGLKKSTKLQKGNVCLS